MAMTIPAQSDTVLAHTTVSYANGVIARTTCEWLYQIERKSYDHRSIIAHEVLVARFPTLSHKRVDAHVAHGDVGAVCWAPLIGALAALARWRVGALARWRVGALVRWCVGRRRRSKLQHAA